MTPRGQVQTSAICTGSCPRFSAARTNEATGRLSRPVAPVQKCLAVVQPTVKATESVLMFPIQSNALKVAVCAPFDVAQL